MRITDVSEDGELRVPIEADGIPYGQQTYIDPEEYAAMVEDTPVRMGGQNVGRVANVTVEEDRVVMDVEMKKDADELLSGSVEPFSVSRWRKKKS